MPLLPVCIKMLENKIKIKMHEYKNIAIMINFDFNDWKQLNLMKFSTFINEYVQSSLQKIQISTNLLAFCGYPV